MNVLTEVQGKLGNFIKENFPDSIPLVFENVPTPTDVKLAKKSGKRWGRVIFRYDTFNRANIGIPVRVRALGTLIFSVFEQQFKGSGEILNILYDISNKFVYYRDICDIGVPQIQIIGQDNLWYQINLLVPFRQDYLID